MKSILLVSMLATIAACSTAAPGPPRTAAASIPFVNHGGIQDWRAPNDTTLYVQARNNRWYVAKLRGDCIGLSYEDSIGFDAGATDTFDQFSSVIVRGQRCTVESLTPIGGPPPGTKPHKMKTGG